MDRIEIGQIVVATDLGEASDRLVRTASSIAALTGAGLHVVHVHVLPAAPHSQGTPETADEAGVMRALGADLDDQIRRAVPTHFTPSSKLVLTATSPSEAIRRHAEELSADLIVIGPHRGPVTDHPFLGTTADRLVSTAGVPCLIVRNGPTFPLRRLGVLVDFSPAAQTALDTATAWLMSFSGGEDASAISRPSIVLGHVVWSPQGKDGLDEAAIRVQPALEHAIQRTRGRLNTSEEIDYFPEVLHAGDATEVVAEWVRARDLSMVVLGTRGTSRLPYVYLGGLASALARSAACSVLLVPPDYAPEALREGHDERIRLRRIVTAVDFHESSWDAAVWAMRYLAPAAEHELIHIIDLPELPPPLRGFGGAREQRRVAARSSGQRRLEELRDLGGCPSAGTHVRSGRPAPEVLRLANEVDADLVVVGEQGPRRGVGALLGSTAERILFDSGIPVLVARKLGDSPPRKLVVAIDATEASERVLDWAGSLLDRFDATATILNVVDRLLLADELTGLPSVEKLHQLEREAAEAMMGWLQESMRAAGLPEARAEARIVVGDPSYEIIAEAQRIGADLVLVGSRGGDIAPTPLIGRIVNKVVRSAPCSVLVVTKPRPSDA